VAFYVPGTDTPKVNNCGPNHYRAPSRKCHCSRPIARFEFEGHSATNNRTRFVPANRLPELAPVEYGPGLGDLERICPAEPERIEPEPYAYTQSGRNQYAHAIPSRCCCELLQRPGQTVARDRWICMACGKSYPDARALADGLLMAALLSTWGLNSRSGIEDAPNFVDSRAAVRDH
jgi:hypothetical protein